MEKSHLRLPVLKKISLILLLFSTWAYGAIDMKHSPRPGGVAVVDFYSNAPNPKAFYKHMPLYVQALDDLHYQVLIGIPLSENLGKKTITIKDPKSRNISFEVLPYDYEEQHITLTGNKKKYVNPNLKYLERINQERPVLAQARNTFSPALLTQVNFIRPAQGITTGRFGLKRFYNGEARRPHTGIDYANKIGTPIKAASNAKVLLIGDFFFNGKTIFLDHGQGLISVYIHMNEIKVSQGQTVQQGQIIGTMGKTGRATGSHLHWGVYLNQSAVDPTLFLEDANEI